MTVVVWQRLRHDSFDCAEDKFRRVFPEERPG
jgi:hypothetical protein